MLASTKQNLLDQRRELERERVATIEAATRAAVEAVRTGGMPSATPLHTHSAPSIPRSSTEISMAVNQPVSTPRNAPPQQGGGTFFGGTERHASKDFRRSIQEAVQTPVELAEADEQIVEADRLSPDMKAAADATAATAKGKTKGGSRRTSSPLIALQLEGSRPLATPPPKSTFYSYFASHDPGASPSSATKGTPATDAIRSMLNNTSSQHSPPPYRDDEHSIQHAPAVMLRSVPSSYVLAGTQRSPFYGRRVGGTETQTRPSPANIEMEGVSSIRRGSAAGNPVAVTAASADIGVRLFDDNSTGAILGREKSAAAQPTKANGGGESSDIVDAVVTAYSSPHRSRPRFSSPLAAAAYEQALHSARYRPH